MTLLIMQFSPTLYNVIPLHNAELQQNPSSASGVELRP
jgi:hypothetical protein